MAPITSLGGDLIIMTTINACREVHAPIDRVWDIVADVDNDPMYWRINSINNISKNGNVIEREVTVGFRNSKGHQMIVLNPKQSVEVTMTEGPVNSKRGDNNKTKIDVSWNIDLYGIHLLGRSFVKNQLINTTKEALDRIAKAVN